MTRLTKIFIALTVLIIIGVILLSQRSPQPIKVIQQEVPALLSSDSLNISSMQISSPAFNNNELIPSLYTCDGENVNPPLAFGDVPEGTKSLVLLMDDPDIPDFVKDKMGLEKYDHWTVFNLPPETTEISENSTPPGVQGVNSSGQNSYTGPCPPDREHRYFFKLFALDTRLNLPAGASQAQVEQAMAGHILDKAELVGLYERRK